MKYKNYVYYKHIDTKKGDCGGRKIEGTTAPKDIKIYQE